MSAPNYSNADAKFASQVGAISQVVFLQ